MTEEAVIHTINECIALGTISRDEVGGKPHSFTCVYPTNLILLELIFPFVSVDQQSQQSTPCIPSSCIAEHKYQPQPPPRRRHRIPPTWQHINTIHLQKHHSSTS